MDTRLLSTYLQEKDNVMISPSFSLPDTVDSSKRIDYLARMKEEKKWELKLLEATISQEMLHILQLKCAQWPIYLDIATKSPQEDVLLFLFKQWIAQSDEKKALALLNDKSFVREQCEEDFQHIQHYEEILETFIQTKETEIENARNLILDMEGKIYRKIILEMMDNADYFFFLDNVSSLTREEQIRVNTLLDRRWTLWHYTPHKNAYVKINDWQGTRKTFYADNNRPMQSPHDFSHRYIKT